MSAARIPHDDNLLTCWDRTEYEETAGTDYAGARVTVIGMGDAVK
jgi:hypothetical protein